MVERQYNNKLKNLNKNIYIFYIDSRNINKIKNHNHYLLRGWQIKYIKEGNKLVNKIKSFFFFHANFSV
jgi:hypothetical protein